MEICRLFHFIVHLLDIFISFHYFVPLDHLHACHLAKIDRDDFDVFIWFVGFWIGFCIANILAYFHAFCHSTEHSVLVI